MAKSKAYTKFIGPIGTNKSEDFSVHQVSPAWVLTFIRWDVRDTLRAIPSTPNRRELLQVRDPLVVENDCVQVAVVNNKSVLTPSVVAILKETDVNYETAIAPGDFMFVNMLNWEKDARKIVLKSIGKTDSINGENDGFKGIFKVQSVRKIESIDPISGIKRVFIKVTGFAFTEFNNNIYFNPYLRRDNQGTDQDDLLFITNINTDYSQLMRTDNNIFCQDIIKHLICSFIGTGVSDLGSTRVNDIPITPNTHFYIPQQVGTLLGLSSVSAAKDVYNYIFGIQQYGSAINGVSLSNGMNPNNLNPPNGKFYYTNQMCTGNTRLKAEYWNNSNAWSIINQYTNSPVNEIYTCFRISPEGRVMPTVIMRQIPFTSELFGNPPFNSDMPSTKFLNLPRWKISPSLILSTDLGRDEAARVNFVQYYSASPTDLRDPQSFMSAQTSIKNYSYDINDVLRNGLRPYIINSTFEDYRITKNPSFSRDWALLLGDSLIGGHLKMNGTMECAGIVDPIAVGDNLEYNGTVYHIEEISHVCSINMANGVKIFRTTLKLSSGVSESTSESGLAYSEMIHTRGYQDRKDDFNNRNKVLPGVSEAQDVWYRTITPEPSEKEINKADKPFAQPGKVIKLIKDDDNDSQNG